MRSTSIRRPAALRLRSLTVVPLLALGGLITAVPAARGADPSPSPFVLEVQAWLDAALPTDAAPGSELTVGAFLWDQVEGTGATPSPTFMRLYPAAGDAPPSEGPARQDGPGHVVATLIVPEGGAGQLQIGIRGSYCGPDGCAPSEVLYEMAGPGPPTDAPLPRIADVEIEPLLPTLVAGEATPVNLVLRPKIDWPGFGPPDELALTLREPRAEPFAEVPAMLVDRVGGRYEASVTLPEPGAYVLEATTVGAASQADIFSASGVSVTAIAAPGATPAGPGSGPAGDGGGMPLQAIVAGSVAVLVLVLVVAAMGMRRGRT